MATNIWRKICIWIDVSLPVFGSNKNGSSGLIIGDLLFQENLVCMLLLLLQFGSYVDLEIVLLLALNS